MGDEARDDSLPSLDVRRGWKVLRPCVERLIAMAEGEDRALVVPAVSALGSIGDPVAEDTLFALLEDDGTVEATASALLSLRSASLPSRVASVLPSCSPLAKAALLEAMAAREDFPPPLAGIVSCLYAVYPAVRRAAVRCLGVHGGPAERERLFSLVEEGADADLAVEVLGALCKLVDRLRDDEFVVLSERYAREDEPRIRASAVSLVGSAGSGKDAFEFLKKALRDSNPRVRANAVEAIGMLDGVSDERKRIALQGMIKSGENNRVLANLAIVLGRMEPKLAIDVLSTLLNSTDKWERASAVYAARFVGSERVGQWLTTLFVSESDPDVLRHILGSLEHFPEELVVGCFMNALEHDNPDVRGGAARSLARYKDPAVETRLVEVLQTESDPRVISDILYALGQMAGADKISIIVPFLQHPDLRVQADAIEALESIGTVDVIPYVEPFLNSLDNRIKANAAVALWRLGSLQVVDALYEMLAHPQLKQRSSAIYALGRLGETLHHLEKEPERYYLLISALEDEVGSDTLLSSPSERSGRHDLDDFPLLEVESYFANLSRRRLREAREAVEKLERFEDVHPLVGFVRADFLRRARKYEQAARMFERLLKPGEYVHINTPLSLAGLRESLKQRRDADDAYLKAFRKQLDVIGELVEHGMALLEAGRDAEASRLVASLVKLFPLDASLHFLAARLYMRTRDYEKAYSHLIRAYVAAPSNAEVLLSLAYVCFKLGKTEEAEALCTRVSSVHGPESELGAKAQGLLERLKTVE